jgi:hypothetical protein
MFRKNNEKRKAKWQITVDFLLRRAIFFDEENQIHEPIPITPKIRKWLGNAAFRQFMIDELIKAKKNLSGTASENLLKLFNQLQLQKDSMKKLSSLKWHIKARGIQELSLMDQKHMLKKIFRLTNNRNEFIRMEAQSAIVQFYGFEGLRFLNTVSQPISEWQQIKLLALLPRMAAAIPEGLETWLVSTNDSVILFVLKLAAINHRFELHDKIAACLDHSNPLIKIQAVKCLQDINNDSTAASIIRPYPSQGKPYQLAVLDTLNLIATENEIPFLKKELLNEDNTLKLSAARALIKIDTEGMIQLDSFEHANEYPWNEIIQQAKSEIAA